MFIVDGWNNLELLFHGIKRIKITALSRSFVLGKREINTSQTMKRKSGPSNEKRVRATLESSSKRGSLDRISSCQEFWNFENWQWEIENILWIVCELKESESHISTSLKKLLLVMVVGGWALIIMSALLLLFLNWDFESAI